MYNCRKCRYMPYTVCDYYMEHNYRSFIKADGSCSEYTKKNLWQRLVYWWRNR